MTYGNKKLEQYLEENFGYKEFRDGQREIIEGILGGKDVNAVMATGHGKSICYQLPGQITRKPVIVVSPLLSLMEDQRIKMEEVGIKACCYNSLLKNREKTKEEILRGEYVIIYMTPEIITSRGTKELLEKLEKEKGITLIAIDEAHCVSLWGNGFRENYLQLGSLKDWLPNIPILTLTATATEKVQNDISNILKLKDPIKIKTTTDRPNLSYYIHQKTTPSQDLKTLINNDSIIIYCQTRKQTEDLSDLLLTFNVKSRPYHAGLHNDIRNQYHNEFINNTVTCIVATISFGMGIDKSNIRKVIHYGCPKDIESYYQEIGRAGRDGNPSQCHVFFSQSDFTLNRYFLKDITDPTLFSYKENMVVIMERFLYITSCRRRFLLNYFNDSLSSHSSDPLHSLPSSPCCDNCSSSLPLSFQIGSHVKDFLSLVSLFSGKYGRLMFINTIRGSNNSKIPSFFKTCKYFSLGSHLSLDWWKFSVQFLLNSNLLSEKSISGRFGSTLSISPSGLSWLHYNSLSPSFLISVPSSLSHLFSSFSSIPSSFPLSSSSTWSYIPPSPISLSSSTNTTNTSTTTNISISSTIFSNFDTHTSSTNFPSFDIPKSSTSSTSSTNFPSFDIPKSSTSSTNFPSFDIPKSSTSSTNFPSFDIPKSSTNFPSFDIPKSPTNFPSFDIPKSSTNFPSFDIPKSSSSSTSSTNFPSFDTPKSSISSISCTNFPSFDNLSSSNVSVSIPSNSLKFQNNLKITRLTNTQKITYEMMINENKTLKQISETRKLTLQTIETHVIEILKNGLDFDYKILNLTRQKYDRIFEIIKEYNLASDLSILKPIKLLCDKTISYSDIKFSLAIQQSNLSHILI